MKLPHSAPRTAWLLLIFAVSLAPAGARTLRLFVIGNSFSNNATRYLPQLAQAGGHELVLRSAQTGGCSFERHWNAVEAYLVDPADPKGKIYGGKSLHDQISGATWDVITVQQYSLLSPDYGTYQPFAAKLQAHLKTLQPNAEIVVHQTWAYRSDAPKFGQVGGGQSAANAREMWEKSRAAYRQLAADLGARIIPTGDAFWRINSDSAWAYKPEPGFNAKTAVHPALPGQTNSLHVGYRWSADQKLSMDANHANVAGEYLGALVWYGVLFGESPEKLAYVPPGVAPDFAAQLRKVAWQVVQETAPLNRKAAAAEPASARR